MKLIVGLGNPEREYLKTRHNLGFGVLDEFCRQQGVDKWEGDTFSQALVCQLPSQKCFLAKPQTGMNASGFSVAALSKRLSISPKSLWVIHDDLDIPLGRFKIQLGKGPKDHNGLLSVYHHLKTQAFWHVRIGIENRLNREISGEIYTLKPFNSQESPIIHQVIEEVCKALVSL